MSDRVRVVAPEGGRMMTKQSMALESDINQIMNRYTVSRQLPMGNGRSPVYGDFSSGVDFHTAMNRVRDAEQAFKSLPAHVRDYVGNDPGKFLDLCFDPDRRDELLKLGLTEAVIPEKPVLVRWDAPAEGDRDQVAAEPPSGSVHNGLT